LKERPDPTTGATLELGFLGSVLSVEIPSTIDSQQLTETSSFGQTGDPNQHVRPPTSCFPWRGCVIADRDCQILASSVPVVPPPLTLFEASLSHLWSIWECMLLCEPVLVFGSSAAMTSQAIWWFRDLLRPVCSFMYTFHSCAEKNVPFRYPWPPIFVHISRYTTRIIPLSSTECLQRPASS
jgi:hypothetical protein